MWDVREKFPPTSRETPTSREKGNAMCHEVLFCEIETSHGYWLFKADDAVE
jgi:hypothetical protein